MWVLQFKWKEKRKQSENHFWLHFISKGFKFCFIAVRFFRQCFFFVSQIMFQLALCANGMGNSVDETVQIYLLVREGEKEKSGSLNVAKIHETNAEKQSSHCIRKENSNNKIALNAKSKQSLKLKAKHIVSIFIKCFSNFLHFLWLLYGGFMFVRCFFVCVSLSVVNISLYRLCSRTTSHRLRKIKASFHLSSNNNIWMCVRNENIWNKWLCDTTSISMWYPTTRGTGTKAMTNERNESERIFYQVVALAATTPETEAEAIAGAT